MKLSRPALKNSRASSGLVWGVWGTVKIPPGFPGFCIVAKLVPWFVGGLCWGLLGASNPNNIGSFCRVGRKLKNLGEISWGAGRLSRGTFPLIASRCLNRCFSGITGEYSILCIIKSGIMKTYKAGILVYCWHDGSVSHGGNPHRSKLSPSHGEPQTGRTWGPAVDLAEKCFNWTVKHSLRVLLTFILELKKTVLVTIEGQIFRFPV